MRESKALTFLGTTINLKHLPIRNSKLLETVSKHIDLYELGRFFLANLQNCSPKYLDLYGSSTSDIYFGIKHAIGQS